MRKKKKRKERARIATFTIMLVSILVAAGSMAISDIKNNGKYHKNQDAKTETSKSGYTKGNGFPVAAGSQQSVR